VIQSRATTALRVATPLLLLMLWCEGSLAAQESQPVQVGDRVRVTAPEVLTAPSVGTLVVLMDTLVVQEEGDSLFVVLPVSTVTRLEVSRRQGSRSARGAGIGFLGGALIGAVYGAARAGTGPGEIDLPTGTSAALNAAIFGAGGALVGLAVGAGIKVDEWESVSPFRVAVTMSPPVTGPAGVTLSLRVR